MLSAQTNYITGNKDSSAAVEFVNNMLQSEASSYLSNMSTLSHVSKMCSSLSAHWPTHPHHHHHNFHPHPYHHQAPGIGNTQLPNAAAAAAAAALAAGHNIESILGASYSVKLDDTKASSKLPSSDFNNSYDGK